MKKNNHKGKRLLAGLLSFLMVATTLPFGEMDVKASSLVPNTSLTDNGDRYPYMETTGSGSSEEDREIVSEYILKVLLP